MIHSFDTEIAAEFGVEEAIAIHSFQWWITKNRSEGRHHHDGRWWSYNSAKALQRDLWPYWTLRQIYRVLESLVSRGVLVKGNWNQEEGRSPFDRSTWFAFVDEERFLGPWQLDVPESHTSMSPNGQMDATEPLRQMLPDGDMEPTDCVRPRNASGKTSKEAVISPSVISPSVKDESVTDAQAREDGPPAPSQPHSVLLTAEQQEAMDLLLAFELDLVNAERAARKFSLAEVKARIAWAKDRAKFGRTGFFLGKFRLPVPEEYLNPQPVAEELVPTYLRRLPPPVEEPRKEITPEVHAQRLADIEALRQSFYRQKLAGNRRGPLA